MTQDRGGARPGAGPMDAGLSQRVEALVDEAVALAAKGSYRDAAARAEQAASLDPDNQAALELVGSYRRLAADDDERRRRRRSLAAAAATIEEMIEGERLDEAVTAVEALALQYGAEAPVEELHTRISQARAASLDFTELDAAIDAIRQPAGHVAAKSASPAVPLDAAGALAAEIEEHLRFGRIEEASATLDRLAAERTDEDRLHKLRNRIDEARVLAAEHRRDEEILIATAAIEERLRRGHVDEAAERLADLAARHGSSAPVDELGEQLRAARGLVAARGAVQGSPGVDGAAGMTTTERTAELLGGDGGLAGATDDPTMEMDAARARASRRWMGIAAAFALVVAGAGWWLSQRAPEAGGAGSPAIAGSALDPAAPSAGVDEEAAGAADGAAGDPAAADGNLAVRGEQEREAPDAAVAADGAVAADTALTPTAGAEPPAAAEGNVSEDEGRLLDGVAPAATEEGQVTAGDSALTAPSADAADAIDPVAGEAVAGTPASDASTLDADPSAPAPDTATDGAADPSVVATSEAVDDGASSSESPGIPEVVVEALPSSAVATAAAEPTPPPAVERTVDTAAAGSASPSTTGDDTAEPAGPASPPEPAAAGETSSAAPTAGAPGEASPTRAALLGCGDPGVVCVKALRVPQPEYPAVARQRRLSGNVVVNALVDETGKVIETRVESGSFRFFDDAAVAAATRSVFQPASRSGVPGRSWARLSFQFAPR